MDATNYRIEKGTTKNGTTKYFLVKDIKVGKKIAGERRYIKSGDPPTAEELQKFSKENAMEIEVEALNRAASLSCSRYIARYLTVITSSHSRLRYPCSSLFPFPMP